MTVDSQLDPITDWIENGSLPADGGDGQQEWWPEPPADVELEFEWGARCNVAEFLAGGMPPPEAPVLLRREDGRCLFYRGKVNVLFGDPESGKTWIALAAVAEALNGGRRAAIVDLDHNGVAEIVGRLLMLGADPRHLSDPERFWLTEPEDEDSLILEVQRLRTWRPAVVVVDSLGELLPMLRLSSNSPDDYTSAHRRVLTPLANVGAVLIAIDHLPKSDDARSHGQTGTLAKRRAVNGVTLRVTTAETFAPGRGGAASMTVEKDRPGGVRAHCPVDGKKQPAGRFVMTPRLDGTVSWKVTTPSFTKGDEAAEQIASQRLAADIATVAGLHPPAKSQRDIQERCKWGGDRALRALRGLREQEKRTEEGAGS